MSRGSLALSVLHTLAALWLAWCTATTWGYTPTWASVLNLAASIVCVMAAVSESDHTDVQRELRVQLERKTRPTLAPPAEAPPPTEGIQLTEAEEQTIAEMEAHYDEEAA